MRFALLHTGITQEANRNTRLPPQVYNDLVTLDRARYDGSVFDMVRVANWSVTERLLSVTVMVMLISLSRRLRPPFLDQLHYF